MVKAVGPGGPEYTPPAGNIPKMQPSDEMLPADSPWVKMFSMMNPNIPMGELMMYAAKFRDNMFRMFNSAIQQCAKKAKETARKFKESINE